MVDFLVNAKEVAIEQLVEQCRDSLGKAMCGARGSLGQFHDAGAALCELKTILPKGQFGEVAQARCQCSKAWRARLMRLHREWADVEAAQRWAEGLGRVLGRREYSVDGALGLVREWRRALSGEQPAEAATRHRRKAAGGKTRREAELEKKLAEYAAYIAALERELVKYRAASSTPHPLPVPPDVKRKMRKTAALWRRGGTEGERAAGLGRLRAVAVRLGWQFDAFLQACGIEGEADFTRAA